MRREDVPVAIDAIAVVPAFLSLTEGEDPRARATTLRDSVLTGLLAGLGFLLVGLTNKSSGEWTDVIVGGFVTDRGGAQRTVRAVAGQRHGLHLFQGVGVEGTNGELLTLLGLHDEALREARRAKGLDPLGLILSAMVAL